MSNTLVIKCSNKEAVADNFVGNTAGDWTTTIQEKIELEEGDSIICRNAFIDTRSTNSQKIIINDDLTLSLTFIKYLVNWRGGVNTIVSNGIDHPDPQITCNVNTTKSRIIPYNAQENVNVAKVDCNRYISCSKKTISGNF